MRTSRLYVACMLACGPLAACGSLLTDGSTIGGPDGSIEASVVSLNVVSQIAYVVTEECDPRDASGPSCVKLSKSGVAVLLQNRAVPTCENAEGPRGGVAGLEQLGLEISRNDQGDLAPGVVPIVPALPLGAGPPLGAQADFDSWVSPCEFGIVADATSGSITITQLTSSRITGRYDLTFGTQGTLSGTFDAPICDLPLPDAAAPFDANAPYCGD